MLPDLRLTDLTNRLRRGDLELAGLLDELQRRIEEREPAVLALTPEPGRFDRLRREAAALERQFPVERGRPALFGVPVGVKEVFRVDGLPTTGGSRLPPDELAGEEAAAVKALKRAGALVLGKTISTEFAYFAPGPTRNPRDPQRTPGGSSSGSAAAVAAGLLPLALGTQTIGSISRPASFCGVTGFKPTYERISLAGVIPLAPSLDHVGTFTPGISGAALAAPILCAGWRPARVRGGRPALGVPVGPYLERAGSAALEELDRICGRLGAAGYRVERVAAFPDFDAVERRHHELVAHEAARVHAVWFARHGDLYHPRTRELLERGREIDVEAAVEARAGRDRLRSDLRERMREAGVDLWLSPAAPGPAPLGLESTGDPVMNLPWTHAGLPTVTIPACEVDGLPLGIQLAADAGRDEDLLAWGLEIERVLSP